MRAVHLSVALALLACCGAAGAQPAALINNAAAEAHVARAAGIAGNDLRWLAEGFMCGSPAEQSALLKSVPGFLDPEAQPLTPFRAFDNLYYVGMHWVGSWILDTGAGLILWDALSSEREARDVLVPGLRALGLDPADIRIVVVNHGHFDHYGGARYLQQTYSARIAASAADWQLMANDEPDSIPAGFHPLVPPQRDMVIADGATLTLGDSRIEFLLTPGHTPGTLASFFEVRDGELQRGMALWGGTAMPRNSQGLALMHNSLHRFWDTGRRLRVSGLLNNHPWAAGNLRGRDRGAASTFNPLVLGEDGFDRAMMIKDECINAQLARLAMQGR